MDDLLRQLGSFEPFTALVIGDFMLDQHVYGAAERLSPDAPVPVLHATRMEDRPGGAANVALCLGGLRGTAICFGVCGDDQEGRTLRSALEEHGCDASGLLTDPSRPTTIKRSLIGLAQHRHPQKMFRVDMESRAPLSDAFERELLTQIEKRLPDADVACLEDYHKGVCSERLCRAVVDLCRMHGKPLLVDPAAIEEYAKYRGATAITPNRSEAELATDSTTPDDPDDPKTRDMAERLLRELALDAVVLTLDRHGALLATRDGETVRVPTMARSVYDVTGAGDMVLAALAGGVANGFSWHDAVRFANAAAGLEVEVFGVQAIPLAQVKREVLSLSRGLQGKVRAIDELLVELEVHREAKRKIVLTNGCFDVIHIGHLRYLKEARRQGDVLIVGVNSDQQVRSLKGEDRPVFGEKERLEILSEFESIEYLVLFDEPTAEQLIRAVKPDLYVKGGDYQPSEINEYALLQEMGIEVKVLAHQPGLGSTQVIDRFVRAAAARS